MKKTLYIFIGFILGAASITYAATPFLQVFQGGTGNNSFASSTIAISNGSNLYGFATSSLYQNASASNSGLLTSTDWSTFNGKQASGNYITALTGDVTASGPGSAAATLATVNSNTGSFGGSTAIPSLTVNGKGLITAASTNVVVAPAGTLSGTTLNSGVTASSLTSVGTLSNLTVTAAPTFSAMTPGSVLFAGTSGLLSQDNSNLFYNSTNHQLGVGSSTPYALLSVGAPAGAAPYFSIGSTTAEVLKVTASSSPAFGVGTSTPGFPIDVYSTATTSVRIDSNSSKGACLIMKDSDGSGYSYITVSNGVMSVSTSVCF